MHVLWKIKVALLKLFIPKFGKENLWWQCSHGKLKMKNILEQVNMICCKSQPPPTPPPPPPPDKIQKGLLIKNQTKQSVASLCTQHLSMMPIVTFTFDIQNSIGFILSPSLICVPSLMKMHTVVKFFISFSSWLICLPILMKKHTTV